MKTQNPWMGRVRGSAGNMTGCKVYDKNVLRAKAFEVSNPDTAAQQTQRDFFKEVAAIVATVSEEEIRSLFGIKPKAMSRRNALSKQVAAAFSVDATGKHVDFSKLQAIGNGKKVSTSFFEVVNGVASDETEQQFSMFGLNENNDANIIIVAFDIDAKSIKIYNTIYKVNDQYPPSDFNFETLGILNAWAYLTCSSNGDDVSLRSFGSFSIKTRSIGKQVEPTPPALEVTIYSGGIESGNFFHFDGNIVDPNRGDTPRTLYNGDTEICDNIRWDEVNNWWFGTTVENIDTSLPITLQAVIDGEIIPSIPIEWVVQ